MGILPPRSKYNELKSNQTLELEIISHKSPADPSSKADPEQFLFALEAFDTIVSR